MKLSDAIEAGCKLVPAQKVDGGFCMTCPDPNTGGFTITAACVLMSAYLGHSRGLEKDVLRALHKGTTEACRTIQDGLMRSWRELGARCPEGVTKAARVRGQDTPKRGESLVGYLSRLNDRRTQRETIAGLLRQAGL
jgi:hypothetical protein